MRKLIPMDDSHEQLQKLVQECQPALPLALP